MEEEKDARFLWLVGVACGVLGLGVIQLLIAMSISLIF